MGQKYAHTCADGFVLGFYDDEWHSDSIPNDAIAITDEQHQALLAGQASGKRMKVSADSAHALVDPLPPSDDEIADVLRSQRDAALASTDWLVSRHQDESLFAGGKTTLTAEQVSQLGAYRKALRDLPVQAGFPHVDFPAAPDFIKVK